MGLGFHEVQFPTDISWGSAGGPSFNNALIETDSGAEQSVARVSTPRWKYNASYGTKTPVQLAAVQAFFIARGGTANGFRFKDFMDFTSNPSDPSYRSAEGSKDQVIGTGDGSTSNFQLIKTYTSGGVSKTRKISKPVDGKVRVWVDNTEVTATSSTDPTTGIVTLLTAPTIGQVVTASFQFDVPVRFGKDADQVLSVSIRDFDDGEIPDIPLIELVDPDPGFTSEMFYGGAVEKVIESNASISTGLGKVWSIQTLYPSLVISLPDPTQIPTGGPIFTVYNAGAYTFTLKDHSGSTLCTIADGYGVDVLLTEQASGTKVWYAI